MSIRHSDVSLGKKNIVDSLEGRILSGNMTYSYRMTPDRCAALQGAHKSVHKQSNALDSRSKVQGQGFVCKFGISRIIHSVPERSESSRHKSIAVWRHGGDPVEAKRRKFTDKRTE
jgi:hypothetical protein